jgi:UDP-N-acetylmuramyl-tripeptide synthetase
MAPLALSSVDEALAWLRRRGARGLCTDSRRMAAGGAFIAWPGYAVDGRRFVAGACAAGAVACLVEAEGVEAFVFDDAAPVASLRGLKQAAGELAALFEGQPSHRLDVVACTGTNGKTSTAWWTAQALTALGRRCGLIGTLGVGEPPRAGAGPQARDGAIVSTGLTTPDPVTLQVTLRRFVDEGCGACALEASSIGLAEHRLSGTAIDVGVFTNFTQDHLDYHGGMDRYWQAKAALFAWPGLRAAVVNVDDAQGAVLAGQLRGTGLDLWTVSKAAIAEGMAGARLQAHAVHSSAEGGLAFELREGETRVPVATALIGDYNVSNLLGVVGALRALGVPLPEAAQVCAGLTPVPGRMQRVFPAPAPANGPPLPEVVVDYAHTPDALEKALLALGAWAAQRGGALWCVFGCGGNRDAAKRPLMGAVAERHAARLVLTSDNPRDEAPEAILAQIASGLSAPASAAQLEDRAQAIAHAVRQAGPQDVILVAGKGHEDTQEVAGRTLPFSDAAQAQAALLRRAQSLGGCA